MVFGDKSHSERFQYSTLRTLGLTVRAKLTLISLQDVDNPKNGMAHRFRSSVREITRNEMSCGFIVFLPGHYSREVSISKYFTSFIWWD